MHDLDGKRLIEAWFAGRAMARGLPAPVRDASGALRVETALPDERRRFLFAEAGERVRLLASRVAEPFVAIRVCASTVTLRSLVPPDWRIGPQATVMTIADMPTWPAPIPDGYRLHVSGREDLSSVEIFTPDGSLAASGHAAETAGVFVFDRIVVAAGHRRRGLGRVVMTTLGARRRRPASISVLVATDEGRALYATLGWRPLGPYSSATSPPPPA